MVPRTIEFQVFRDNVEADSASQYYRRSLYLPYIDGLKRSLRERSSGNPLFFSLFSILPPNNPTQIHEIAQLYSMDNLESEVTLWRSSLAFQDTHKTLQDLVSSAKDYPSVLGAIQIILALPATTVEADRTFSCMKRVKTWLRSTMSSDRLSNLCLLHRHRERMTKGKIDRVVTSVACRNRRMVF